MAKNIMNTKVDIFLSEAIKWQSEFEKLKWGKPCYLFENRNIVLIHGFKEYGAILFFKALY